MPRIRTLTARSFRGIREASLSLDGRSLVLLGENGTGKSSFVDTLEFLVTGKVDHLEGAQAVSTVRHAPHILGARDDAVVELTFDQPNVTVSRTFRELSSVPAELDSFLRQGANTSFILRRKQLLEFILAAPASRYEQLAAIIGVEDLDKVERALMQARDELCAQKDTIQRQLRSEETKLNELLGEDVSDDGRILAALNRRLSEMGQNPLDSLDESADRKVAAVKESRSPQDTQTAVKIQNVLTLAADIRTESSIVEDYQRLSNEVDELQRNAAQVREILFREVLATSSRLLRDFELDHCPVCLQPIEKEALLASLERRVRDAEAISQKTLGIKRMRSELVDQIRNRITQIESLSSKVLEAGLVLDKHPANQFAASLSSLLPALQADPVDMRLADCDDLALIPTATTFAKYVDDLLVALQSEKQRLEPTDQDKLAVTVIDLLTRVIDLRQLLMKLYPESRAKEAAHQEIASIYDCFVRSKRTEVQSVYRDLETDIKRFFQLLHTDDEHREVRLDINEGRRASTEIRMDFHDRQQEDPRAFNSEGHLDSLGLCVFLAFVKHFNTGFPLIVLDDVVSSIDSGHRQCICGLLFQEFSDYQLFITTHDHVWFEELCAHQREYNKEHLFVNLQILDWSLDAGPRLDRYKPRWERAEEKLSGGDKDGAAADARKALEHFLFEACVATKTHVELKRNVRYVVSELHAPFVKHLRKLVPTVYQTNQAVFQNLGTSTFFGNLLVHDNPYAGGVSTEEVRTFIDAVKALEGLFTCGTCKRLVEYHRDARVIKCRCGAVTWATRD